MKAYKTALIVWGIASLPLSAQLWPRDDLATGPGTASLIATAVDKHGRVHTVYTQATGIALDETTLVYEVTNAAFEFTKPAGATFGFFDSTSAPTDLSMTVTDDFRVQVASINRDGEVSVAELSDRHDTTWETTQVSLQGSRHLTETGVSIAAGAGVQGGTALVYTRRGATSTEPGKATYHFQNLDGTWSPGVNIFETDGAGVAPILLSTSQGLQGNEFISRAVVAYDVNNARVHTVYTNSLTGFWGSADIIAEGVTFTAPDAAYHDGQLSVAWSDPADGVSYATRQQLDGTSGTQFAHYGWMSEFAVPASETGDNEFFGNKVALALDAGGHPQVAFTRHLNFDINGTSALDVQVWRKFSNLGWSQAHRHNFASTPPGANNRITGLDIATHLNGDPVVVYQRDPGRANSVAATARPRGAPWVVEKAPLLDELWSWAPALATGKNGELHMVSSYSTFPDEPVEYHTRLVTSTPSGSTEVNIPFPSLGEPTSANAITITPDGIAHIVGIRPVESGSDIGELSYWSGPPTGPITLQTGPADNAAKVGLVGEQDELILKSDAVGNLLLAFPTASGFHIVKRNAQTESWESPENITGNIESFDGDMRADGGYTVAYYNSNSRQISLITSIDTTSGSLTDVHSDPAFGFSAGAQEPFDIACALGPDGRPRIAYSQGGIMNFLSPSNSGSPLFSQKEVGINANDSTVEIVAQSDRYHLLSHSTAYGNILNHHVVKDSGQIKRSIIAFPGLSLTRAFQRQGVSATLDRNGHPIMAVGLGAAGLFAPLSVMLARPGDSLDTDGDGLPLLLEGAHCYNPTLADAPHSLVNGEATKNATFASQLFEYRRPDGFGMRLASGRRYADFDYEFETSVDLLNWEYEEEFLGEVAPLLIAEMDTDEGADCIRSKSGFLYIFNTPSAGPKRFGRLRISRAR